MEPSAKNSSGWLAVGVARGCGVAGWLLPLLVLRVAVVGWLLVLRVAAGRRTESL